MKHKKSNTISLTYAVKEQEKIQKRWTVKLLLKLCAVNIYYSI